MGLSTEEESVAYQLGCQFRLFEVAQLAALGKVNAGVKDKFFGAASATPRTVFSSLHRNFANHVATLRKGTKATTWKGDPKPLAGWLEKRTTEIHSHLDSTKGFPATLSLADQGMFVLGYYHQRFSKVKDVVTEIDDSETLGTETTQGEPA